MLLKSCFFFVHQLGSIPSLFWEHLKPAFKMFLVKADKDADFLIQL